MESNRSLSTAGRAVLLLTCVISIAFVTLHAVLAGKFGLSFVSESDGVRQEPSIAIFAVTGFCFLLVTIVSHFVVFRELAASQQGLKPSQNSGSGMIGVLLVTMSVRFAGTFAVLGVLLFFELVGKYEAVFDVLFWYVTLTTIEVGGIVWASKMMHSGDDLIATHSSSL